MIRTIGNMYRYVGNFRDNTKTDYYSGNLAQRPQLSNRGGLGNVQISIPEGRRSYLENLKALNTYSPSNSVGQIQDMTYDGNNMYVTIAGKSLVYPSQKEHDKQYKALISYLGTEFNNNLKKSGIKLDNDEKISIEVDRFRKIKLKGIEDPEKTAKFEKELNNTKLPGFIYSLFQWGRSEELNKVKSVSIDFQNGKLIADSVKIENIV